MKALKIVFSASPPGIVVRKCTDVASFCPLHSILFDAKDIHGRHTLYTKKQSRQQQLPNYIVIALVRAFGTFYATAHLSFLGTGL